MIQLVTFLAAAALCALVAFSLAGSPGLEGAGVGASIAGILCAMSALCVRWARRAKGNAMLAAMLGTAVVSFALITLALLAIASLWQEILVPAGLTATAVYVVFRFAEAFRQSGRSTGNAGDPARLGGVPS